MIVQNVSAAATGRTDISFTLPKADGQTAIDGARRGSRPSVGFEALLYDDQIGKVSLVGAGMRTHPGVSATFFGALADAGRQHRDDLDLGDPHLGRRAARTTSTTRSAAVHTAFDLDAPTARPSSTEGPADERLTSRGGQAHARRRRRDRRRRHRDAATCSRRASRRLGRDPAGRLGAVGRQAAARVRGEEVEVQALAAEVFDGVDVAMFDVPDEVSAAVGADRRGARRRRRRQLRCVPDGPRRAARRARGQPRRAAREPAQGHHRQPQLHDAVDDRRARRAAPRVRQLAELVVASYQAASGAGPGRHRPSARRAARSWRATATLGHARRRRAPCRRRQARRLTSPFPAPLALNVVPFAGSLQDGGWSCEELKVRNESRKILGLPDLKVSATCVRVPVITTHSLAVHAVFEREVDVDDARAGAASRRRASSSSTTRAAGEFPTPADVVGTDPTFVGRLRQALDFPNALDLFVCGDNLRKGAALNTAQIAELVAAELAPPAEAATR